MDVAQQIRDADRADSSKSAYRPLGTISAAREGRFQVVIRQSALDEIHRHGKSTTEIEVCGVLVGDCYRDASGPYLHIDAVVRGAAAPGKGTQVTFTADTWTQIQAEMDAKHPNSKILGWYHTHPGFGIFLSDMDLFIQENFFNLPWQAALVYDPVSEDEGVFIWRNNQPTRDPWLVEDEDAKIISKSGAESKIIAANAELMQRMRRAERRIKLLFMLLLFLFAFLCAWAYTTLPPAILNSIEAKIAGFMPRR